MIGIYKITNLCNGMVYVGQTNNIHRRWQEHRTNYKNIHKHTKLYEAMRQFGIENFNFSILEECSLEKLNEREQYWIKKLDTFNNGYNMSTIENLQSKIKREKVQEIQKLLQTSNVANIELANRYGVSPTWITLVNKGELWFNPDLSYPLRPVMVRKKAEQKYCIDCGKAITANAIRCTTCNNIHSGKLKAALPQKISREELKILIRKYPFTRIGEKYGVTDNAVRKWCKKYNLPYLKRDINSYTDEQWKKI